MGGCVFLIDLGWVRGGVRGCAGTGVVFGDWGCGGWVGGCWPSNLPPFRRVTFRCLGEGWDLLLGSGVRGVTWGGDQGGGGGRVCCLECLGVWGQTGRVVERELSGGFVNEVVRVGDTVRRPMGERAEFVHRVLGLFEEGRWSGAPQFLGVDERGREMLTFVEGEAGDASDERVGSVESLVGVARLVRRFHDLTAGTALAGGQEVVCHNDLSPRNTVYRDLGGKLRAVAFIDWDLAGPGSRIQDVAHVCWQYLELGPDVRDVDETAGRMRAVCDAYGLIDRSEMVETILWWQERTWRGIAEGAADGDAAMARLFDSGVVASIHAAAEWVTDHRGRLDAALA